jgi:thiosulfate dehydrogenase
MDYTIYYPAMWLVIGGLAIGLSLVSSSLAAFRRQVFSDPALREQHRRQLRLLVGGQRILWAFVITLVLSGLSAMYWDYNNAHSKLVATRNELWPSFDKQKVWVAPDAYLAQTDEADELITYGRDLIAHTQDYFGANGTVKAAAINGLNCQSCHLEAGTKPFGNNYFAVESTYPQLRARSGAIETIPKRVNDCFERSLNGQALDTSSLEMKAIVAYMHWLGIGVPKGEKPKGTGLLEIPFLQRAADPVKGQLVYTNKCASCHGADGQGLPMPDSPREYPPLWGDKSYNEAAGLFRLSRFAAYVKANMPFGATYQNPQLSDEESWDVAAFVNTQARPKHPFLQTDWPTIEKKPFDHPFGPYADPYPESQHKYGPFEPIIAFYKSPQKKN